MQRSPTSSSESATSRALWPSLLGFIARQSERRQDALIVLLVSVPMWSFAILTASVILKVANEAELADVAKFVAGRLALFPLFFCTYLVAVRIQGSSRGMWRFWVLQISLAIAFLTLMYPLLLLLNFWAFGVAAPTEGNFVAEAFHGDFRDALAPFRLWELWLATSLELAEIYLLGLALILALNFFMRYRAGQAAAAELHARWLEAQLASLREKIGPHFLFNALTAIVGLIYEAPETATKMTIELGALLRHNLDRSDQEFMTVRDELEFVGRYLAVMKIRFGARLQFVVDVDPAALPYRLPAFLLLPLVENAVKHGVARIPGVNSIEIQGRQAEGRLTLKVINVAEREPEGSAESDHRAIGLDNSRSRIAALYGERGIFTTGFEDPGRWVTTVVIPAEEA